MSESKLSAETVARLRGLMERASQGHWTTNFPEACEMNPRAEFTIGFERACNPHLNMDGRHARWEATAELISAMHDALPALLSAAEENERLRRALADLCEAVAAVRSGRDEYEALSEAHDKARAALAPADEGRRP